MQSTITPSVTTLDAKRRENRTLPAVSDRLGGNLNLVVLYAREPNLIQWGK